MSIASLSFFRFQGTGDRLWAFSRMALARRALRKIPGIGFHKLLGTGTREGFHPVPNFSVYAILATWPSLAEGHAAIAESAIFRDYRAHSAENWTVFLGATRSRGCWARQTPFVAAPEYSQPDSAPVAVLTRATLRPRHLLAFWRQVPNISATIRDQPKLLFQMGLGEVPWLHQVTFSIWSDRQAMEAFAFRGFHAQAIAQVQAGGWFSEALFARFRLLHAEGQWAGTEALARAQGAERDDRAGADAA